MEVGDDLIMDLIQILHIIPNLGFTILPGHPGSPHQILRPVRPLLRIQVEAREPLGSHHHPGSVRDSGEPSYEPPRELPVTMTYEPHLAHLGPGITKRVVPGRARHLNVVLP